VPGARIKAWPPVLAIAGMVARTVDVDGPLTPLERFFNLLSVQTATLSMMDNAPGNPQTVILIATVIDPQASFNPTSLSLETLTVNTSPIKIVTQLTYAVTWTCFLVAVAHLPRVSIGRFRLPQTEELNLPSYDWNGPRRNRPTPAF
jgi:hypothetical protein